MRPRIFSRGVCVMPLVWHIFVHDALKCVKHKMIDLLLKKKNNQKNFCEVCIHHFKNQWLLPVEPRCTAGETVDPQSSSLSPSAAHWCFLPLQCTNVSQNLLLLLFLWGRIKVWRFVAVVICVLHFPRSSMVTYIRGHTS